MALGAILRAERERRGLTEHQVADATRMMVQMVRELEEEDFHRIAAPIYGRGFIKLYAKLLELDPAPLMAEFDRLYAERGHRQPPPRVALERFGGTPGASLERVEPQADETSEGTTDTKAGRENDPSGAHLKRPAKPASPTPVPVSSTPVRPAADLFGEPLTEAAQSVAASPVEKPTAAPVEPPRPLRTEISPEAAAAAAAVTVSDRPRKADPAQSKTADSTGAAAAPVPRTPLPNLIDSASQRFDGRPFRPSIGRRIGTLLGGFFGLLAAGISAIGRGITRLYRGIAHAFSRERMGQLVGPLARVNWSRVARIGLPVVAALLVIWLGVGLVRKAVRNASAVRVAAAELAVGGEPVTVERILPPPAGYVEPQ